MQQSFNIQQIDPQEFETQVYATEDSQIISQFEISEIFDSTKDYIEYFIYDANQELLYGPTDSEYTNYRIYDNKIAIDPQQDITDAGYTSGQYFTIYNFLTNLLASTPTSRFFISELSSDRTELRLDSNTVSNSNLIVSANELIDKITNSNYYFDFYLNFGNNQLVIANNVALDQTNPDNPTVLIKLYEPLPSDFDLKSEVWVVENLIEPVAYNIEGITSFDDEPIGIQLRGPNLNIGIGNQTNNSDTYYNFTSLNQTTQATGTGSLQYAINSILEERGIEINIDYSNYVNFVHFSSAQARLENFYYKLSLIEQYQTNANAGINNNTVIAGAQAIWQSKIDNIITNFDGYEYYLYYSSASTAWPKTNTEPPFINYTTTSTEGLNWFTSQSIVAENYDESNKDALVYAIPPYLKDDPQNSQFELFTEMIGQHFDVVWTYTKDITNRYNADNRLDYGISKDLVADVLKDFGMKIYQNNFSTQNLYSTLLGVTPSGSLINIPNSTLTLPAATGYEYLATVVTASLPNQVVPLEDANKELYKRIYHNLPLLLKKKGTTAGLKLLLNLYGVPDTILRINEFGGQDKINTNDWDNWQDTFNYSLYVSDIDQSIYTPAELYPSSIPNTIMVRVKSPKLSEVVFPEVVPTPFTDNIMLMCSDTPVGGEAVGIYSALVVEYTGSGLTSGSYSGSTYDPYYQYATVKWIPNIGAPQYSASAYIPFYNEDWWSIMITIKSGSLSDGIYTSSLYIKQKGNFEGDSYIKYEQSQQVLQPYDSPEPWETIITPYPYGFLIGDTPINTTGYTVRNVQELRYYNTVISESIFDDYVMNPYSIEGNQISGSQSSYSSLRFRAPLGSDLDTSLPPTKTSIHPSITGSKTSTPTASFSDGSSTYASPRFNYQENQEYIYQKQPNAGIQIATSDKIKIKTSTVPAGNVLSQYISIQQQNQLSESYTRDVNYVEVGFSPQDEINDDIIDQLGYFNYGDYIGDPRFQTSSLTTYPELNALRDQYFLKYIRNYNLADYLRLIKFFDNSLFKMIKDFVPARTGLASGAIIKQHLLERNRYRVPQADWEDKLYTASVTTLANDYRAGTLLYTFTGSTGGTFPYLLSYTSSGYYPPYVDISQSWAQTAVTPLGVNTLTHNNLEEFYNGELSGSILTVTEQSLIDEDCKVFLDVNVDQVNYIPVLYRYDTTNQGTFLSSVTPIQGEINLFYIEEEIDQGSADSSNNNLPTD